MTKNITLSIPDNLELEMDKFVEVNWSAVARDAIEIYIKRRSDPAFAPVVERLNNEKDALYNKGRKEAKDFITNMRYEDVERIFGFLELVPSSFKDMLDRKHRSEPVRYPAKVPDGQPEIYLKGFQDAFIELKGKLAK